VPGVAFDEDPQDQTAKQLPDEVITDINGIIASNAAKSDDDIADLVIETMRARRIELEPRAVLELIAQARTTS
jgi:hypothetical protein